LLSNRPVPSNHLDVDHATPTLIIVLTGS
jgi:hypothetical protein